MPTENNQKLKKVTVIGGGTGTFVTLTGLKQYGLDLAVVVSMMDSGGSTGRLRDQLGVLPPGDVRQCLVALSDSSDIWRQLFLYRFTGGDLEGHNFGNILLSALEKVTSDYQAVIDTASQILHTKGQVLPVTFATTKLCARYDDGSVLTGEGLVDENQDPDRKIVQMYLQPPVEATPVAIKRLMTSDFIVIGPGDLYTSIVPVLLAGGIKPALTQTKAKLIFVMNLMTKLGQTTGYTATKHLEALTDYLGRKPEVIVINDTTPPAEILKWYQQNQEQVVVNDIDPGSGVQVIQTDLIDTTPITKITADVLTRSILRHDPHKLADVLLTLLR